MHARQTKLVLHLITWLWLATLGVVGCNCEPEHAEDAGPGSDAQVASDARVDAATSPEAGSDAARLDSGAPDLGRTDLGVSDQGPADARLADLASGDAGGSDQAGSDAATPPDGSAPDAAPRVCEGSFTVQNSFDVDALAGCRVITGNLTIAAPGLSSIAGLASLVDVQGTLTITGNSALVSLAGLQNLAHVGALAISGNPLLTQAALPALASVTGTFSVTNNAALATLGAAALASVGGAFMVYSNPALWNCAVVELADQLTTLGGQRSIFDNLSACSAASCGAGLCVEDCAQTGDHFCAPATTISALRTLASSNVQVSLVLRDVYVAYARTLGYTVQAVRDGPGIFVFVPPATHQVTVGNRISLWVTAVGSYNGLAQITEATVVANDHATYDVRANLRQSLSTTSTAPGESLESELVGVTGAVVTDGSANTWTIRYGVTPTTATLYAYEASALGLCVGAVVDLGSAYVSESSSVYTIRSYYVADFDNVNTDGCPRPDGGPRFDSNGIDGHRLDSGPLPDVNGVDGLRTDAGGSCLSIAEARALPDGAANADLCPAYVTYVRYSGFFVQAERSGPALFVYVGSVDAAPPAVAVGNRVSLHISSMTTYQGVREIVWGGDTLVANDNGSYDVATFLAQDLSADAGTLPSSENISELVTLSNAQVVSGGGRDFIISYGGTPLVSDFYAYEGGLCTGATFDLVAGFVDHYSGSYEIHSDYAADLDAIDLSGCPTAAQLRLNEISAAGSCDLVELRAVTGGSVEGVRLYERTSAIATLPVMTVAKNDYLLIHFASSNTTCNPNGSATETTSKTQFPAATYTTNSDTAWDIWITDTNLTTTDNVLTLFAQNASILDGVLLTNTSSNTVATASEEAAELLRVTGQWLLSDGTTAMRDYFVDDNFRAHAVPDLAATGTIQHLSNEDTNKKTDWTSTNAAATLGANNAGQTDFP